MTPQPMRLADLVARFGGELVGDPDIRVSRIATLRNAAPGDLSFVAQTKYRAELARTRASAVIVAESERDATSLPRIVCRDPYAYLARVAGFFSPPAAVVPGV